MCYYVTYVYYIMLVIVQSPRTWNIIQYSTNLAYIKFKICIKENTSSDKEDHFSYS